MPTDAIPAHFVRTALIGVLIALPACNGGGGGGGGGSSPTSPSAPTATGPTHSVDVVLYYDENENGRLDGFERVRIPEATVDIDGRTGQSAALTGEATVGGVPEGTKIVAVRPDSLPPYYEAKTSLQVSVPTAVTVELPITLQLSQGNLPNRYLAFGDSLTEGDNKMGDFTYRLTLQAMLEGHFGIAELLNAGASGTTSAQGAARIKDELVRNDPAIVLIAYGTNDWNTCLDPATCFTVESIRTIIRETRNNGSWPFVATIPPTNTGFDDRAPASRNDWVSDANELIIAMAAEEGAVVMDVYTAMVAAGDLAGLFEDHVHPSQTGYDVMAESMFEAIARGRIGAASRLPTFGFSSFE